MGTVKAISIAKKAPRPELALSLLPVAPQELPAAWRLVEKGVLEVLESSRGEASPQTVFDSLLVGARSLWIGSLGGDYAGFVITQVTPQAAWRELFLYMVWGKPGARADLLAKGLPILEDWGRRAGCRRVVFASALSQTRGGRDFPKRVEGLGFKPHYVEYVKELEEK